MSRARAGLDSKGLSFNMEKLCANCGHREANHVYGSGRCLGSPPCGCETFEEPKAAPAPLMVPIDPGIVPEGWEAVRVGRKVTRGEHVQRGEQVPPIEWQLDDELVHPSLIVRRKRPRRWEVEEVRFPAPKGNEGTELTSRILTGMAEYTAVRIVREITEDN
jgi:hypothetical protein